ncbi:MAG: adenylate/guanylate cyclase domain-containing protein, partial [Gammaproteobacteria bacterium]
GPRATVAMLNEYFSDMVDIIDQHDGILDKYIGDAIMALFGVPFSGPRDERNAVNAANGMMRALNTLNERRVRAGQEPLMHGIGVNTGEAVAGNIGSPKRMDYTAIGDAVNLTARIESATKYYGTPVLLSGLTLERIGNPVHMREVDRIRVKGKTEPVTLYESFDWRAETLSDETMRAYEYQRDGLERYRAQAWRESFELFTQASRLTPTDALSPLYLERIRHYESHAPGDDWDGVWTMQNK